MAGKSREAHYRLMYDGMTGAEYKELHARQGGRCAICRNRETKRRKGRLLPLAVDHDHATGATRGLLCSGCNVGIGYMKDSPGRLRYAADYLERHISQNEVKVYF